MNGTQDPRELAAEAAHRARTAALKAQQARGAASPSVEPPPGVPLQPRAPMPPGSGSRDREPSIMTRENTADLHRQAEAGPPPSARPPAPAHAPTLPVENPILTALKRDLLVEHIRFDDVVVGDHRWSLGALDGSDSAHVNRLADLTSATATERQANWEIAWVAMSIQAIDGEPVWRVFGVVPKPDEEAEMTDPMRPPRSLRYRGVGEMVSFLASANAVLTQRLYSIYEDRIDPAVEVHNYLSDPGNPRYRYECERPGCEERLLRFPVRSTENGVEQAAPPFCPVHGTRMSARVKVVGDRDLPLS